MLFTLGLLATLLAGGAAPAPNILWITCEDMSPNLGCFGDPQAATPNLDRLAESGLRFTHCFATSGVCAPSRSCLITGVYPTSLGTHFMRCEGALPAAIQPFPAYLRAAGYYTSNNAKTDYNFKHAADVWDANGKAAHWRGRKAGQPFFSVFNLTVTHESQIRLRGPALRRLVRELPAEHRHDPARATLPPFLPTTPEARQDWTNYQDLISVMDQQAGALLRQLAEDQLGEATIVFFFSDHGVGLPRAKRWLYDSSLRVPLIVRVPGKYRDLLPTELRLPTGAVTDRLVSFIDFAPTILSLAGVDLPKHFQGAAFLGRHAGPARDYVFGVRDRMDERTDMIRAVRDRRFKYLRNYYPHLPWDQPLNYAEVGPTLISMRQAHAAGRLPESAARFFARHKPPEELFDTQVDPHELHNLAKDPTFQSDLERLRAQLDRWQDSTIDLGFVPEAELRRLTRELPAYDWARRATETYPLAAFREGADWCRQTDPEPANILALLRAEAPVLRFWGVQAAATHPQVRAQLDGPLNGLLRDANETVRVAAAGLVGKAAPEIAVPVLVELLSASDPWVRHGAMQELDRLGQAARQAQPAIKAALTDDNPYVVRLARHALYQLGVGPKPTAMAKPDSSTWLFAESAAEQNPFNTPRMKEPRTQ